MLPWAHVTIQCGRYYNCSWYSPGSVMNTHESFYSIVWFMNLKNNNNQYYADEPVEDCSKRQYYWMRNKEQYIQTKYIHYPLATNHGLGCSQIPWMCTIQVYPSWRLQVDWISNGLAGGEWVPWVEGAGLCFTWFHMGQAGQRSTVHQLLLHDTLSTTAHLMDWAWPFVHPTPFCPAKQ
jgi:hypothetical protein